MAFKLISKCEDHESNIDRGLAVCRLVTSKTLIKTTVTELGLEWLLGAALS